MIARALHRLFFVVALVLGAASCALVVSFDDYVTQRRRTEEVGGGSSGDAGIPDGPALYRVGGTVVGLGKARLTVTVNEAPIEVGEGSFVSPAFLPQGARWIIGMKAPSTHACVVAPESGTIAGADGRVAITCIARDATLSSLTVSIADLAPAFSPTTLAYVAHTRAPDVLRLPRTATVTATLYDPAAHLTVAGAPTSSGAASAPIALKPGPNPVDVAVTAAEGTVVHTQVVIDVDVNDYLKASNTRAGARFGAAIAATGDTLVVGSPEESSASRGVNGDQMSTGAAGAGAVYVFKRTEGGWSQQAYLKASNTRALAHFGAAVAIDGDTIVVGSPGESSAATGVGGDQGNTTAPEAGAVYIFTRVGNVWTQSAYVKPAFTTAYALFGAAVAISGNTIGVGAPRECGAATGVNGDATSVPRIFTGAAYVFTRTAGVVAQQAYVKASYLHDDDRFGSAIALEGDTLVVGAPNQPSSGADETDASTANAGAVYVFGRAGSWAQHAFVKAPSVFAKSYFGSILSLSSNTLAVAGYSGNRMTAYVLARTGIDWAHVAPAVPSSYAGPTVRVTSLALSGDTMLIGARDEGSAATRVGGLALGGGIQAESGAAYLMKRSAGVWTESVYVKASNTAAGAHFGATTALGGSTLFVGAIDEASAAVGVDGDETNTGAAGAGAVYAY